jgi:enediyne biosynthesis protein E4
MGYGQFKDVSSAMGPGISEHYSSRGTDLPSLLRNDGGNQQNCIKCKLIGTKCNRTAIRARVRVVAGGHAQMDEAHSGSRVMSQGDPRLHFGLGKTETVDLIEEVKWRPRAKSNDSPESKVTRYSPFRKAAGSWRPCQQRPDRPAAQRSGECSNTSAMAAIPDIRRNR